MEILPRQYKVPEIYGDFWFNSDPIPLGALGGYVILIDFWDYASHRCVRALPYIREWHRRYADLGLVTIGVHTPQFPFGADALNVREAIEALKIPYPVVMDNNYSIWNSFHSQIWPTRYLIDKSGYLRFVQTGDASYQNFEHELQSLLSEAGYYGDMPMLMEALEEIDRPGAVCYRATPDILTGWQRGTIGNIEGYSPESTVHYEDPGVYLAGRIYLRGNWLNDRTSLRLNDPREQGGYLVISYEAKEVSVVVKPEGDKNFQVVVQQDDKYLTKDAGGEDIRFDEAGRSYFTVDKARLFHIIRNREYGEHKLMLTAHSNSFAIYAMSFISSVIPEMISNN